MTMDLETLKSNLLMRGYHDVHIVNRTQLIHWFDRYVEGFRTVGFGGSITTRELKLPERCRLAGQTVLDHWDVPAEQKDKVRHAQLSADLFVTAVNAVTSDGILVNADGLGNRIAATIFGPSAVLWIITPNKIVDGMTDALHRIRHICSPKNARRLGIPTPCSPDMVCRRCLSEHKIDRVYSMFEYCPGGSEHTIMLLEEALGY